MVVLKIKSIDSVNSIKIENPYDKQYEGIDLVLSRGDGNAEKGSIIVTAELEQGVIDNLEFGIVFSSFISRYMITSFEEKGELYKIELETTEIHLNGFEFFVEEINTNDYFYAFNKETLAEYTTFKGQEKLLSSLIPLFIPQREKEILAFAKTGVICKPSEYETGSYFIGNNNHTDETLMHLATIQSKDFPELNFPNLSFYLNQDWDETLKHNKVEVVRDFKDSTKEGEVYGMTTYVILDLPYIDHPLFKVLAFNQQELSIYGKMIELYFSIILGQLSEEDNNKVGGYPNSVQYSVTYWAERDFNKRAEDEVFYEEACEWIQLLQVSPYDKWFSFFDDFGDPSIHFMIRKSDLASRNFDNVQIVMQST